MRGWLVVLAVGCGGGARTMSPGWKPAVGPPFADPTSQVLVLPILDGQSGTELLVGALSQARQAGATGLSEIAIQLGRCVRDIGYAMATGPLVDPVTYETTDADLHCTRKLDQELVPGDPGDEKKPNRFRDTQVVEHEDCTQTRRQRIVTRERVDFEHGFSPPQWSAIAVWTGLPLHAGPMHCDAHAERDELRLVLHFGEAAPGEPVRAPLPGDPAPILAAVARARGAPDPASKSAAAEEALALWRATHLEDGQPPELAAAIAEALYLAVEADATRFLAEGVPAIHDLGWMEHATSDVHAFAARYRAIGDSVQLPVARPWMLAAGKRLEAMHLHLADLYDSLDRAEAARQERAAAQVLAASAASGAPVKR